MTTMKDVSIRCDADGCQLWEGHGRTAAEARRNVKQYGWTRRNGKDYCPEHSAVSGRSEGPDGR